MASLRTFSNDEMELFDNEWREEVKVAAADKFDDVGPTTEYYSRLLKDYVVDAPKEKLENFKESAKEHFASSKEATHDFLEKEYEKVTEFKDKAKEKAIETALHLEERAHDHLDKWSKSLKSNSDN